MDAGKALLSAAVFFLIAVAGPTRAEAETAVQAAEAFVALVDAGDYCGSWEAAASIFRTTVTRQEWEEKLQRSRPLFGGLRQRTVRSTTARTTFPGLPDGDYLLVLFDSALERKAAAVEVVTVVRESGDLWRVCGYAIR